MTLSTTVNNGGGGGVDSVVDVDDDGIDILAVGGNDHW